MKRTEMRVGITYVICPNKKCKLFWDTSRYCPCDGNCPWKDRLKFIIICHNCGQMIILSGDHHLWQRIDHLCPDGRKAGNFRMSGKYHLLYKIPAE